MTNLFLLFRGAEPTIGCDAARGGAGQQSWLSSRASQALTKTDVK